MRHLARFSLIAAAISLAVCAISPSAYADTEGVSNCGSTCNGYSFQSTLTLLPSPPNPAGTYSLSYQITNNNSTTTQNAYAFNWSLTLFPSGSSITSPTPLSVTETGPGAPTGDFGSDYLALAGKSNNGSNGNCNATLSDAICVTPNGVATTSLPTIAPGQTLTFSFDFTCASCASPLPAWDFLASGKCVSNTNSNCYAITQNGAAVSAPEPSVPVLLMSELVLLLGIVVVFRRVRNRNFSRWTNGFRLQPPLTS